MLPRLVPVLPLVTIATLSPACTSKRIARPPAIISHVVLVSLNDPSQADAVIADCDKLLANIPCVSAYAAGKHLDTGRNNIDGGYDVGIYIGFNTTDDYAAYVTHPQHVALVEKWKPATKEMRIVDFKDE